MLVGREVESARVDLLLAQARRGSSAVLVMRGEPGIGKSALCEYGIQQALGMTILAARGVESEAELAYAGLADLFRPVLHCMEALPAPQAAALAGALAIAPPAPAEPFTVAAATLSLLAAAEDGPLLAVIDDAHWLDQPSAQALSFAARRLEAEGVALLIAARSDHVALLDVPEAEELVLAGLELDDSKRLLAQVAPALVADAVAERLHDATGGNPLALVEACGLLSERQLAGREPLDQLPLAGLTVQRAFLQRLSGLPNDAQRALLVAAASDSDAIGTIAAATRALGIDPSLLELPESAGLVCIADGSLTFHHPLVRSAVYYNASGGERRSAHRALAEALAGEGSSARRAWHLAGAALAPDEDIAAELEQAALDARARRGHSVAASAFERAALLTPDDEQRARRLLEAATDLQLAGASDAALGVLDRGLACAEGPLLRAKIQHLRGRVELWRGRLSTAHELLVSEAAAVEALDRSAAALMLAEACVPCLMDGDYALALKTARRASALAEDTGGPAQMLSAIVLGEALILCGESRAGCSLIRDNCGVLEASDPLGGLHEMLGTVSMGLIFTEEFDLARRLLDGAVNGARAASAPGTLPWLLACRSQLDRRTGRWRTAYAEACESCQLAEATGQSALLPAAWTCCGLIEAVEGKGAQCRAHAAELVEFGRGHGIGTWPPHGGAMLGLLELGLGRPEEAIDQLEAVENFLVARGVGEPACFQSAADLIEAYVHAGRLDDAAATLATLQQQATYTQGTWALAVAARCRGLLAEESAFDECFAEAVSWHDCTPTPFDRARTQLCHGERLRRSGRRVEARAQLRSSLECFEALGAAPWAARARSELRASGERARRREPFSRERLTPRELQVGTVVAEGATNREAAASLFLTPKTIEFHLGHVYRKLGIRSRAELARLFAANSGGPALAAPLDAATTVGSRGAATDNRFGPDL